LTGNKSDMAHIDNSFIIPMHPIGIVSSVQKYPYDAPRQGVFAEDEESSISLFANNNYEQCLQDLDGFERIWILFHFNQNQGWRPLVRPPRFNKRKYGLFATRSPYRPNGIGMTVVRLLEVKGRILHISGSDMLDGTPVLDIKPYIPYSDAFPDASAGWVDSVHGSEYSVVFSDRSEQEILWLKKENSIPLHSFISRELEYRPTDGERKRLEGPDEDGIYCLAYRTWRISFLIEEKKREVQVINIFSGYTSEELADTSDKYGDKPLHLKFLEQFGG